MKKLLYILLTLTLVLGALSAQAADTVVNDKYTLLEPLPCIEGTGNNCVKNEPIKQIDFNTYLAYIFKFGIAIAGFLAIVMIIVGGFEYMLSEAPFAKTNGKDRMTNAIIGLLGVLTSYLILVTIDPRLVQINSALPRIEIKDDLGKISSERFADTLKKLSAEEKIQTETYRTELASTTRAIQGLEDKDKIDPGLSVSQKVYLESLKPKVKEIEAKITKVLANRNLDDGFAGAMQGTVDYIKQARDYNSSELGSNYITFYEEFLKNTENDIPRLEREFAEAGEKLKANNDLVGYQELLAKKDFYKLQIVEFKLVAKDISYYEAIELNKDKLVNDLTYYQKRLAELGTPPEGASKQEKEFAAIKKKFIETEIALYKAALNSK